MARVSLHGKLSNLADIKTVQKPLQYKPDAFSDFGEGWVAADFTVLQSISSIFSRTFFCSISFG